VGGAVRVAHRAGRPFRLTELNSVTCGGLSGISDTFATALWAPDAIFDLLAAGVDGVNIHTRAYAINAPFALSSRGLLARPLLYGLVFAARSLSPGGELLRVRVRADRDLHTRAWVVRVRSGALHVVLLDKGQRAVAVALRIPGRGPAEVQRLLAPSVRSRSHVTLAGQHLGRDGSWWGQPRIDLIGRGRDGYAIKLPPFSAALVIVHGARRGA
jgi:hypothetical protein